MQGTRMSFRSKEDAIHFAEKQGQTESSFVISSLTNILLNLRVGLLRVSGFRCGDLAHLLMLLTGNPSLLNAFRQRTTLRTMYTNLERSGSVELNRGAGFLNQHQVLSDILWRRALV
jgi:hypothetical protein